MSMVRSVVGGVNTHADFHVAAAINHNGDLFDPTGRSAASEASPIRPMRWRRLEPPSRVEQPG